MYSKFGWPADGLAAFALALALPLQAVAGTPAPEAVPEAFKRAVVALGGEQRLGAMKTLTEEATGTRRDIDQNYNTGERDPVADPFEQKATYDLVRYRMRLDIVRHREGLQQPHPATYVLNEQLGATTGQVIRGGKPAPQALSSDRWAAVRREQLFVNPLIVVKRALETTAVHAAPDAVIKGKAYEVFIVDDEGSPITLFVDPESGRIDRLDALVSDFLRRDCHVSVAFSEWRSTKTGISLPTHVEMSYDDEPLHEETRTRVEVTSIAASESSFALPEGITPLFDSKLAKWGAISPIDYTINEAYGNPNPGLQADVTFKLLAPDIYLVGGSGYNSLVVGQDSGVVIVEAPQNELRTGAVIDFVKKTFPNKLITNVISTHHHADHTGGLRAYAALGTNIVAHEANAKFLAKIFERPSEVRPDPLSANARPARIQPVAAQGFLKIPDKTHAVYVYPMPNEDHAKDMMAVYIENPGVIFVTDIYTPNPNAKATGPGGPALKKWIQSNHLEPVSIIAGGHGSSIDYQAFQALPEKAAP